MEHKTLVKILEQCRPNGGWVIQGERVAYDDGVEPLTEKELREGAELVESLKYREDRAKEYPPIADQLDALWKGGAAAEEMRAKVNAVKSKFPAADNRS